MKPEFFTKAVEEFRTIYQEEFGIEMSMEEAAEKAQGLLQLFDCLTQETEKELK